LKKRNTLRALRCRACGTLADAVQRALPAGSDLSVERWRALRALDRYVLVQLARRGKLERLAEAYREICE